jgi:hypothetical protein
MKQLQNRWITICLSALVSLSALSLAGCEAGRFMAYAVGGDGTRTVQVKAQYRGLEGKTFAVLVASDDYTQFAYPGATAAIGRDVTARIGSEIPGASPLDPARVAQFQRENPYWITVPYGQLIERLGVERLVVIDLVEYSLREPGNAHVWQGQIVANVGVAEFGEGDGNAMSFSTTVKGRFPDNSSRVGVLNSDDKTIQFGLLADFSARTTNLFRDHEETR